MDLNLTIGTPTEAVNKNGTPVSNPNTNSVNSYFSIGPQFTLNLNEFFNFQTSWGNHLSYLETGFCHYQRYKMSSDMMDPEPLWGYNLAFGYGMDIKDTVIITFGFVKGFFFNSEDEFQSYPWILNTGLGFRF